MRMVPVIKTSDLNRSIRFYTETLDFERKWPEFLEAENKNGMAGLIMDGAELQLSAIQGTVCLDRCIYVDDVDERYNTFRARGLDTALRPESPIHTAPVDQTWGLREFSVTDPDGTDCVSAAAINRD